MALTFNPMQTTNAAGLFYAQSDGLVQGEYQFDPVSRQYIAGGFVDSGVTQPVWGGMAITENIPVASATQAVGSDVALATAVANLTGFTVATQMHNSIVTPGGNSVGTVQAGMGVQFARLGSGLRLAVQCDSALVSLDGGAITQQVAWDFTNQKLIAYTTGTALPVKVLNIVSNSKIVSYSAGVASWAVGYCALILL